MDVSENSGTPKSYCNRVFHYKPSILGYPYFWKHPYKQIQAFLLKFFCVECGLHELKMVKRCWNVGMKLGVGSCFICRLCFYLRMFTYVCYKHVLLADYFVHFDSSIWCMILAKRRWQKPWTSLTQWKIGWLLSSSQFLRVRCLFEWHLTSSSYEGGAFRNEISLVVYVCIPRWARFPMWCIYLLCI